MSLFVCHKQDKSMDIQAQKALIIEQFQQIDDINLIRTIKSLLDYANLKKHAQQEIEISENQKEIVRRRIKLYEDKEDSYLSWDQIEKKIAGDLRRCREGGG